MRFTIVSAAALLLPLIAAQEVNTGLDLEVVGQDVAEAVNTDIEPLSDDEPRPIALFARTTPQQDRDGALAKHNAARKEKNLPALTWSNDLQQKAQDYACVIAKKDQLVHGSSGENLYWRSVTSDSDLMRAADAWISEKKNYSGQKIPDGNFGSYGHYTQVMWKNTKKVGIAACGSAKGGIYVVARYDPVGNYVGQTPY